MRCQAISFFILLLALPGFSGCGGDSGTSSSGDGESDVLTVKTYEAARLLPAEFETPELDNGRIKVPTPKGWKLGNRQNNIVIRFYTDDSSGVPRVVMTAEASTLAGVAALSLENVAEVADEMLAELDAKAKEKNLSTYREPCRPIVLGNNVWIRHVVGKKWKGHAIDCVVLRSVFDKRVYKLELEMMAGEQKFKEYQNALYAIAGHMQFIDKSAPPKTDESLPVEEAATKTEEKAAKQ